MPITTAKVVLLILKLDHVPLLFKPPFPEHSFSHYPEYKLRSAEWSIRTSGICSLFPLWSHVLLVPWLTLLQPHWPPCYSANTQGTLLPQDLCTTVYVNCSSPRYLNALSLSSHKYLHKCYLISDAFSDHLIYNCSLSIYHYLYIYFVYCFFTLFQLHEVGIVLFKAVSAT